MRDMAAFFRNAEKSVMAHFDPPSLLMIMIMNVKLYTVRSHKQISHVLNTMVPTLLCEQNCLSMPSEAGIADCWISGPCCYCAAVFDVN